MPIKKHVPRDGAQSLDDLVQDRISHPFLSFMKNVTAPGPTALLTEDEMLRVIGVCRATYRKMVKAGKGLPYVLVGKRRRYAWPAVLARLVENTTGEKSSK